MSFFGIHILSDDALEHLKAAGHTATAFVISETDQAVAAAKGTELGKAVSDAIDAVEDEKLSGGEKFEKALSAILPEIVRYASSGGVGALLVDAEDFGRQLLQSVFNDLKSGTAQKIATELLAVFKH